ncbi:sulfurtransferase [Microcoleus sp. FACHB-831]|uniref:sulfurtransferase n=1 Tax=Microcoleus sp. FACHB-831 TaxID=2692827 RepID=UPI001686006D|nr:rhodanese-like domain-containing protein [Microcoleus sp. FACHB-831]MBD1923471.1 sulfurtransferase [Microcoleus sp. FACHB-831]
MSNAISDTQWVVSATQAKQLIERGATILDTRNIILSLLGHIPGAVRVAWQDFSQQEPHYKGKLIDNPNILQEKIRAIGICNTKPVIVVGNPPHNFGEEGRIVWMLRTLGHQQAAFVDGGHNALVKTGIPIVWESTQPKPGDFVIKLTPSYSIDFDELKANIQNLTIIDTREPREYAGATPYGEKKGGHIPGAKHFYFKDLMDTNGYLLPSNELIAKLNELAIKQHTPITAYCTGGIRSAFFVSVLTNLGFNNIKNYAGSMWEWSASNYPLEKSPPTGIIYT